MLKLVNPPSVFVVGRAADQDKAPVAIAAFGIAALVNLQPHTGVAQRCRNVTRSVTGNAGGVNAECFGRV
jgi:hypothetical protein